MGNFFFSIPVSQRAMTEELAPTRPPLKIVDVPRHSKIFLVEVARHPGSPGICRSAFDPELVTCPGSRAAVTIYEGIFTSLPSSRNEVLSDRRGSLISKRLPGRCRYMQRRSRRKARLLISGRN